MEPGASVAEYHIAGRADDTRFAEVRAAPVRRPACRGGAHRHAQPPRSTQAARLGDVVTAALPDAKIVHHCVHPADWESFSRRLGATLGLPESALAAPIVWSHGRHIGDHTAWAARVQDRYGLTLDVGPDDVRRLAADHLERAEGKRASTMVRRLPVPSALSGLQRLRAPQQCQWASLTRGWGLRRRQSNARPSEPSCLWIFRLGAAPARHGPGTAELSCLTVCISLACAVQNDFCAGGSLEVPDSTTVIHEANALRREVNWDLVVLTQDFHPSGTARACLFRRR